MVTVGWTVKLVREVSNLGCMRGVGNVMIVKLL